MKRSSEAIVRRTAADDVYDRLYAEITSLSLLPGAKLSEVEIARRLQVSRQPVREAFIRLHNAELLRVQPQKATEVRRISEQSIHNARFVRLAVEIEVVREACKVATKSFQVKLATNIRQQRKAIDSGKTDRYHSLDYSFHKLICQSARREFAFSTIESSKTQVDRLCLLSLTDTHELKETYEDHCQLLDCIVGGDEEQAVKVMRRHLRRLDSVIQSVKSNNAEYFEAD